MSRPKDAQYDELMNQIRYNRRRAKDRYANQERLRIQRRDAVGRDNVAAANRAYDASFQGGDDIDQEYDRLVSEVIRVYGQGGHHWPD